MKAGFACKGIINSEKKFLIDIEIQLNWLEDLEDRLFEYGTLLRNLKTNKLREEEKEKLKNEDEDNDEDDKKALKKIYIMILLLLHLF